MIPKNTYLHRVRLLTAQLCALAAVSSASAQQVKETPPPASAATTPAPAATTAPVAPPLVPEDEDTVLLSPFTVQTSKSDIGYYASNTLAGSRLNSKLGDLASPITVITKQQLEDTGARDLNDVFLYEANTEGSLNYTKIRVDRGGLKDEIGGSATNGIGAQTSTTANRIRGLTNADVTWNYYPAIARIRGDSYNTDSFEISRGPNSILAGLGSPAGILNQSIGTGRMNANTNEVNMTVGGYGSYRGSFAVNRTLIRDKLSIYLAALYDDREFSRKPSFDRSRRQTGGFTFRPFKKTTIKGFIENYRNESQLPNQLTPRDGITPWLSSGRPTWDPVTRMVTVLDTGATYGPYLSSGTQLVPSSSFNPTNQVRINGDSILTDRRSTGYLPGIGFVNGLRPVRSINPDGSFFWTQAQAQTFNIYAHPTIANQTLTTAHVTGSFNSAGTFIAPTLGTGAGSPYDIWSRRLTTSSLLPSSPAYDLIGGTSYVAPSINNKALYDWEKINIAAVNHGEMRATTYNLEFEQQLLPNLFFSTGWFRQDLDSIENYPLSQLAPITVAIDTNKNLVNGQPNPNFLKPFVDIQDPDTARTPETREVYRAMLAYDLDFTKRDSFIRWLGRHRFLAFGQHQEDTSTQYRYRFAFSDPSDPRFLRSESTLPAPGFTGALAGRSAQVGFRYSGNASTSRHAWYVGGPNSVVSAAPASVGNPQLGTTERSAITAYNYQTGAWEQAQVTYGAELFDAGAGYSRSQRLVNTTNLTAQSFWLNERVITTLGLRRDKWKGRSSTTGADENGNTLAATGDLVNALLYPAGSWRFNEELGILRRWARAEFLEDKTGSAGVVVKPLSWFSLHANKSDNFNPPATAQVDFFRQKLPTPTGESKDYGFTFNLLDNKLIARVTFFETLFNGDRNNGSIGTVAGRVPRQDTANLKGWAEAVVRIRSNFAGAPTSERQLNAPNGTTPTNTWTDASQAGNQLSAAQIAMVDSMMGGLSSTWPDGTGFSGTQNAQAEGAEVEIIYNPLPNWNIKLAGGKQETTYSEIFPEYDRWVASRMPAWLSAEATDMAALYTQPDGKQFSLQKFWSGYGFGETHNVTRVNGANPEEWLANVVTNELANARILQNAAPYGQRKYRANLLSNYLFTNGILKNVGIGGAVRWEDRAVIGYRGKMDSRGLWTGSDPDRPVYDTDLGVNRFWDLTHFDFWVSYRFKMWNDKVRTKIQLNVTDALQDGRLVPVYVNYDGSPAGYRIVDSRRWQLTAKFEF